MSERQHWCLYVFLCLCIGFILIYSGLKRISFEEFLPILHSMSHRREQGSQEDFVEGLRVFDKDGNGFIAAGELRHVLTSLGERLSDEEVDQLLQGVEHDSQGQINYEGKRTKSVTGIVLERSIYFLPSTVVILLLSAFL